jgi:hypothetical protein
MYIINFTGLFTSLVCLHLPVVATFVGTIWGLRRLFRAKRRFVDLLESNSFKSKSKMNEELLKNIQITYAPIVFMKTCGILFPLFIVLAVLSQQIGTFRSIALAGTVEFTLLAAGLSETFLVYLISLSFIVYIWILYFILKHTSRKIRIDIMTLFNAEIKDINI